MVLAEMALSEKNSTTTDEAARDTIVYTIIVTYNAAPWIKGCLESLASSRYPVPAVVVDNGSSDATRTFVRRSSDAVCLEQEHNLGFGIANNIGIRYALENGADYVFLLNQDARVQPETLDQLLAGARHSPNYGILSPMHLDGESQQIDYRFSRYLARAMNPSFTHLLSDLYFGRVERVYPISFANAAAWLVSRRCLEQVGGFDPLFHMYGEDDDFCNRLRYHGWQIGLVPAAIVYHERSGRNNRQEMHLARRGSGPSRRANQMAVQLKDPAGSFVSHLWAWITGIVEQGLGFLLHGDLRRLASLSLAAVKTAFRLPRIWRHRDLCHRPGAHWLQEASE